MTKILYANITLQDRSKSKAKTYVVNRVPFVERKDNILHYENVRDRRLINKTGAKNDLYIVGVEVIKVVGESQVY